jgi:hypothetical protein
MDVIIKKVIALIERRIHRIEALDSGSLGHLDRREGQVNRLKCLREKLVNLDPSAPGLAKTLARFKKRYHTRLKAWESSSGGWYTP